MGLMDIGSNNPYARINPFAAFLSEGLKGYTTESDRINAQKKEAAAQAQQAQILEFARQDAERKNAAEVTRLQKLAEEAAAKRAYAARTIPQYGFQRGPTEPMQAPMNGLMSAQGSMNPFVDPRLAAMQGPQEAPAPQPVANMGAVPQAPMTQRDMLNFRAQYAGTPTAEAVGQNAVLMGKDKTPQTAWAEKVLSSPKDFDDISIALANRIMGVEGGGVIRTEKPAYKQRQYEKGNTIIHEFSNDDGKTWQPLSDAPRYKPASGDGGRKYEFKDVMGLRKEFSALPEVKDYVTIDSQARRARAALAESLKSGSNNTPVDQTVITTFNKILDPTSVVRESEYARTPQDMAVLNRLKGSMEKIAKGGAGLDRETRAAMLRMVENFHNVSSEQYNATVENYSEIARRNGFDPKDVIKFGHSSYGATPKRSGQSPIGKVGKYSYTVSK